MTPPHPYDDDGVELTEADLLELDEEELYYGDDLEDDQLEELEWNDGR